MIDEGFTTGDSVVHRLDPRVRLASALAFSIVAAWSDRPAALLFALALSIFSAALAGLPLRKTAGRLMVVNSLILLLWIFLPFTFAGEPLLKLGPLTASRDGVIYTAAITIKSNAIVLVLMSLVSTMSIFTMGRAMRNLGVPEKITYLLVFTYRYIQVIQMEYVRLTTAARIRGFRPKSNLHTYRTYAYLVGMLLIKSYERAGRVRDAMLCRGFEGRFYDLIEWSFGRNDWVTLSCVFLCLFGIGLLEWMQIAY